MVNIKIRRIGNSPFDEDTTRTMLQSDFDSALCMAQDVKRQVDEIWDQNGRPRRRRARRKEAWLDNAEFVTWFGDSTRHVLIRRVRRRIHKLEKWLRRARIGVIIHTEKKKICADTTNAFAVIPRRPVRIHLCPNYFEQGETRRPAILIHELVHQLGFGHQGGTTQRAQALELANRNSKKARKSPENYEHLYEIFFC